MQLKPRQAALMHQPSTPQVPRQQLSDGRACPTFPAGRPAPVPAQLYRATRVDDVADAADGDGGLGNVGGQHHL